jgi:hypothetical protein
MIDKTDPSNGMLEEHIKSFLERFAPSMVEHIFRLKRLIYWKCDGIIWIGYANYGRTRGCGIGDIVAIDSGYVVVIWEREKKGNPRVMNRAEN